MDPIFLTTAQLYAKHQYIRGTHIFRTHESYILQKEYSLGRQEMNFYSRLPSRREDEQNQQI